MKIERKWQPSADFPFFLYDPEGDNALTFYRTAEDRDRQAAAAIQEYLADGAWSPEVEGLCCGVVTHTAQAVDRVERPTDPERIEEEGWESDMDYRCNYKAIPISEGNIACTSEAKDG